MKNLTKIALAAAAALALSACGTISPGVLQNLEGCERQYDGVVSAGLGAGFSGTVRIRCAPVAKPEAKPAEQELVLE